MCDVRAPQRLHEFQEKKSSVAVGFRHVSLRPIINVNIVQAAFRERRNDGHIVDLAEADIRHTLRDQAKKASTGKLNIVECPTVHRLQDVL